MDCVTYDFLFDFNRNYASILYRFFNYYRLGYISQNLKTSRKGESVIPLLKHHMANQCTKLEVSSFSRSGDILIRGEVKKLNGSPDHNHAPFGGDFLFVW